MGIRTVKIIHSIITEIEIYPTAEYGIKVKMFRHISAQDKIVFTLVEIYAVILDFGLDTLCKMYRATPKVLENIRHPTVTQCSDTIHAM